MARNTKRGDSQSTLGAGCTVKGNVSGSGDLTIDGAVEGNVTVSGAVELGAGSSIRGDVASESLVVGGELDGDTDCAGPVRVLQTASVRGVLKGAQVAIEAGAKVSARLDTEFDLEI